MTAQDMSVLINSHHRSNIKPAFHLMSWCPASAHVAEVEKYAKSFSRLLSGRLTICRDKESDHQTRHGLATEVQHQQPDLVLFHNPVGLLPIWMKPHPTVKKLLKQMPTSLLILRSPQWPVRKILLVLRDSAFDPAAIAWASQIACKSSAGVTVLPVLTPLPHPFEGISLEQHWLILLSNGYPLSKRLLQVSQYINQHNIQSSLSLRKGTHTEQMRQEIIAGSYDLIITAADPTPSIMQWIMGELANPLLRLSDVPVLIAKPTQSLKSKEGRNNGRDRCRSNFP